MAATMQQQTFGAYRLIERLNEGGLGAVFRAQHGPRGHEAAIKLLPTMLAEDEDARRWFARGAASAAGLQHANILPVWEYGEAEGKLYLVMPYSKGGTLLDRMRVAPSRCHTSFTMWPNWRRRLITRTRRGSFTAT